MGMNKCTLLACIVVGALGLLTVILGIAGAASAAKSLVKNEDSVSLLPCKYQTSPAVGCGAVAALLALTTQIVASAVTGCCGCCRSWSIPSEAKRIVAIVLSTFSWILSFIVVILFMVGAVVSMGGDFDGNSSGKCVPPGTGVLTAATVLFIITVVCQIASYILLDVTTVAGSKNVLEKETEIATGKPAVPPNNADQKATACGSPPPPSAPAASSEASVDPPPSAPPMSSEASVGPPPPTSVSTMSPKASDNLISQV